MKSYLSILALVVCLALLVSNRAMAEPGFKETLNKFIIEALLNHPEIQEARKRIQVFREIPAQAGALEDPVIQLDMMNLPTDTFSTRQEPMTQKQVTLSQKIPFPGKLDLKTSVAEKDVDIVSHNLDEQTNRIIRDLKKSYFELCFILMATEITEQNKTLLSQFVTIAESKYSVGKGIQQDVIKAQVELSKIIEEIIRLKQMASTEKARLNTLMNRLPQATLEIPHGIERTEFHIKLDELQALAEAESPSLRQLKATIERNKVSKQLAERDYYPNFNVGVRYGQREDYGLESRPDFVSGFVGFNVPLWHDRKQSKKVLEETYRIDMAREAFKKSRNEIFLEIKKIADEEDRSRQVLDLIRTGILPQAQQSLDSALSGYSVDKLDFLTLLDNQVTLFKWRIKYHRELTHYEINLAELEYVVGKRLFK